jgi:hypothetical protein
MCWRITTLPNQCVGAVRLLRLHDHDGTQLDH